MKHNPLLHFPDGLEITYSDLKRRKSGADYVTIYFEQPNSEDTDFNSAAYDFPGGAFYNVVGYTRRELSGLWEHLAKAGQSALEFAREDAHAEMLYSKCI